MEDSAYQDGWNDAAEQYIGERRDMERDLTHARSVIKDLSEALYDMMDDVETHGTTWHAAQAVLTKHAAEIERCK